MTGFSSNIQKERYLRPFQSIEKIFDTVNLDEKWERFLPALDDATMTALEYSADVFELKMGEPAITPDMLKDYQTKVEDLLAEVLDTPFPHELKEIIVQKLEEIRRAILHYRVGGAKGLERALEGGLGAMFLHHKRVQQVADERQKKILAKVLSYMANVAQILDFAVTAALLAGQAVTLLGPGVV